MHSVHDLSFEGIIIGFILTGIYHGGWRLIGKIQKHLETERGQLIHAHVKSGHKDRFKKCATEGDCSISGTVASSQVDQPA